MPEHQAKPGMLGDLIANLDRADFVASLLSTLDPDLPVANGAPNDA